MTDSSSRGRFFLASCIALIATAMSFAIRGDIMGALEDVFRLSKEDVGLIASTAFWGFTLSIVIGGPLCDWLGMGRLMLLAFLGHVGGVLLTIFAGGFWALWSGTLMIGLANGLVEAACNPLIATVYPDRKTHKLNQFHVWFPGGIVIGGLVCFLFANFELNWQAKQCSMLLPTLIYGFMLLGMKFPKTERVAAGVSAGDMFRACATPLFVLMMVCMLFTAATELGTNQWITNILQSSAGASAILVLVWINGLMAAGRQFAGPVVHKLSPTGMLFSSSILSAIGLYLLSVAHGTVAVFAAATVFALGICYFWPTMLGFTAERSPRTGALGLALMGGAGMLSSSIIIPIMGRWFDDNTLAALPEAVVNGLPEAEPLQTLRDAAQVSPDAKAQLDAAEVAGGAETLQNVVWFPIVLCVVFGLLFLADKRRGGYRAADIGA